jgi:hypothetical protein
VCFFLRGSSAVFGVTEVLWRFLKFNFYLLAASTILTSSNLERSSPDWTGELPGSVLKFPLKENALSILMSIVVEIGEGKVIIPRTSESLRRWKLFCVIEGDLW